VSQPALPDAGISGQQNGEPVGAPRLSQGVVKGTQLDISTDQNGAQRPLDDHPSLPVDPS